MNKKGAEDVLWNVILILVFLSAAGLLFQWMSSQATGKSIKAEAIAKQTALLIDASEKGTTIFVSADVTIDGNKVIAVSENIKFEYSFFNNVKAVPRKVEGGTEIKIE